MSKDFADYGWKNLIPGNKAKNHYKAEILLKFAVRNFAKKFSPKKGILDLGGKLPRTKSDAIEFMVNEGLCDNKKEAEGFLKKFNKKRIDYLDSGSLGLYYGEYFKLDSFVNSLGNEVYVAEASSLWRKD